MANVIFEKMNNLFDNAAEQYQRDVNAAWQQSDEEENINSIAHAAPTTFTEALLQMSTSEMVSGIVQSVESGMVDPLKALAAIKKLEALVDAAINKDPKKNRNADQAILLQSFIQDAISHQPEKKFGMFGATFTKTEVGTKYNWSQCNDPELVELETAAKEAADKLKAKQEFLKTVPVAGLPMVNQETGEAYTIYPPSKTSTSSVSVSFK